MNENNLEGLNPICELLFAKRNLGFGGINSFYTGLFTLEMYF